MIALWPLIYTKGSELASQPHLDALGSGELTVVGTGGQGDALERGEKWSVGGKGDTTVLGT